MVTPPLVVVPHSPPPWTDPRLVRRGPFVPDLGPEPVDPTPHD